MDPDDHGLEGYSAGGWFVVNAMFTRPGGFAKYLAGAPSLYFCRNLVFEIEDRYAAEHDDLRADIFFGIGDLEMTVDHVFGCLSSTAKMVELLSFRAYPSLRMTVRVFPGESHATARPHVIGAGARSLWSNTISPTPLR
jgi:predicted alpha/beta superfamily hydrolase